MEKRTRILQFWVTTSAVTQNEHIQFDFCHRRFRFPAATWLRGLPTVVIVTAIVFTAAVILWHPAAFTLCPAFAV
jgi:hypothetical protein